MHATFWEAAGGAGGSSTASFGPACVYTQPFSFMGGLFIAMTLFVPCGWPLACMGTGLLALTPYLL
jgi:hypothetical protein